MKKVPTNQGVVNIALIVIGIILSAILIGFFTLSGVGKPTPGSSLPTPPAGAPIYPNLPIGTLPPGCTETSAFSVTTGEPCHPASTSVSCGLTVLSPALNQTISDGFVVSGRVNGCGWTAFEAQTGTVQVFKANGTSVSNIIPLVAQGEWMQVTVNFKATLDINQNQAAGSSGFLLFKNEDASGMNPQIYKLPIKF